MKQLRTACLRYCVNIIAPAQNHMRDFCPQAEDIQEQLDWIDVLCPAKWQKQSWRESVCAHVPHTIA